MHRVVFIVTIILSAILICLEGLELLDIHATVGPKCLYYCKVVVHQWHFVCCSFRERDEPTHDCGSIRFAT